MRVWKIVTRFYHGAIPLSPSVLGAVIFRPTNALFWPPKLIFLKGIHNLNSVLVGRLFIAVLTSGEGCPNDLDTGSERSISQTSNEHPKSSSKNGGFPAVLKVNLKKGLPNRAALRVG